MRARTRAVGIIMLLGCLVSAALAITMCPHAFIDCGKAHPKEESVQEYDYVPSLIWCKVDNTIPSAGDTNVTFTNGRLGLGTSGKGDQSQIYNPGIMLLNGTGYLYYVGYDGTVYRNGYCAINESGDLLSWRKVNNTAPGTGDTGATFTDGRLGRGVSGGDSRSDFLSHSALFTIGTTNFRLYAGRESTATFRGYMATGSVWDVWTKHNNSIPSAANVQCTEWRIPLGSSGGDTTYVVPLSAVVVSNTVFIVYAGYAGNSWRMYTATNGVASFLANRTLYKVTNAVPSNSDTTSTLGRIPLGTSGKGDSAGAGYYGGGMVVLPNGLWYLVYSGYDGSVIRTYSATSWNGLVWSKVDNSLPPVSDTTNTNGRIGAGTSGRGDAGNVVPSCLYYTNEVLYCFYYASDGSGIYRFYCATQTVYKIPK